MIDKKKEMQIIKLEFEKAEKALAFMAGRAAARRKRFIDPPALEEIIKNSKKIHSEMLKTMPYPRTEEEMAGFTDYAFRNESYIVDGFIYERGLMEREKRKQ